MTWWPIAWANEKSRIVPREFSLFGMGLRGDWFKVATCAASTAIWIATCGRPDVADVKKLQRVPSPLPTPPLSTVRRASVNSRWRHGLPVCASSVSGQSSKVPISTRHSKSDAHGHAACWHTACAASTRRRGGWWFIELQHLHLLLFHPHHFTHTHTHSLSHTHTHCQLLRFRRTVSPCVLYSRQKCYGHLNKRKSRDLIAPLPPPSTPPPLTE